MNITEVNFGPYMGCVMHMSILHFEVEEVSTDNSPGDLYII